MRRFSESLPQAVRWLLALVGSAAGAMIGYWIFRKMWWHHYWGPPVIGVMAGICCRALDWRGSWGSAVIACVAGICGMLYAEAWRYKMTGVDGLLRFLQRLDGFNDLWLKLLMWSLGAAAAFLLGLGSLRKPPSQGKRRV